MPATGCQEDIILTPTPRCCERINVTEGRINWQRTMMPVCMAGMNKNLVGKFSYKVQNKTKILQTKVDRQWMVRHQTVIQPDGWSASNMNMTGYTDPCYRSKIMCTNMKISTLTHPPKKNVPHEK